jgi:hypothetical protein
MSFHDYITTPARRVTPSAFPSNAPPAPKLSFAEDAAQCNARLRKAMGLTGNIMGGDPKVRKEATLAIFAERDDEVLDLLQHAPAPMTVEEIKDATGFSDKVAVQTLRRLRLAGKVFSERENGNAPYEWGVVE